jgi:T5SS/PEP-CTERM-associated repeat protein
MIRIKGPLVLLVVCLGCLLASAPARAATDNWNILTNGLFNTPGNWTPGGPPGAADVAQFNVNSTYTVTFTTNVTNSIFEVDNGNVTFGLGGNTYTTTSTGGVVGAVPGQTGQLIVTNGKISGNLIAGISSGATGFITISNFGVWNAGGQIAAIGSSGAGTLTINNGGQFLTTGTVNVGSAATGDGTLVVSGIDSNFSSGGLNVGASGQGVATISAGASAKTQAVILASQVGSSGSLTITGTSSLLDTSNQAITIGSSGPGHLFVNGGGTLNTGAATLASGSGSSGDATVDGVGSTWNISNQFIIGNTGPGIVNISNGGSLNTSGPLQTTIGVSGTGTVALSGTGSNWLAKTNVVVSPTGTLTVGSGTLMTLPTTNLTMNSGTSTLNMNGGTIDVGGSFSRLGNFNFNDGTIFVRGAYSNSSGAAPLVLDGTLATAMPTLELLGNFSTTNISTITVGNLRQGMLVIGDGRNVNVGANNVSVGAGGGSNGILTLTGDSAQLTTTGITAVGGSGSTPGGTGLLTVANGATLNTGTLDVYGGGTVVMNGGGTLNVQSLSVTNGTFEFNSGTVNFTGSPLLLNSSQLDFLVGASGSIGFGRTISSSGAVTISAPISISGGTVSSGTTLTVGAAVQVTNGTLAAGTTLTNNAGEVVQVSGTGLVTAPNGIANNGTIQLNGNVAATSGGTLTNSGIIRGAGFVGNNLTNNAAGQVQVTTGNRLEFDGSSNTNTGLVSLNGGELDFTGPMTNSASTGLITGDDAILRTGGITNNGGIGFTAGTMDVYGKITNNVGGQITCSGGGTTTFYDDVTIASGAASVKATAVGSTVSTVVFFGSYNGGIVGGGTAFIEGDLRPGNSPGVVNFGGNLVLDGGSQLLIDLGGTTAGNGAGHYDQVNVVGNVSIGGGLTLSPYGGFVPQSGDKFVIMTYASETGTFAPVSGTTPAPGLTLVPVYLPNNLVLLTIANGEKTWGVDSDGNFSVGSNWIGGIAPGGIGDSATFSTLITAPRVVTVDVDTTLGNLKFDSPISYTIAGPNKLTLQASGSAAATITDFNAHGNGAHTISAPLALASDLNVVQNSSGTLRLSGALDDSAAHAITLSGSGTMEIKGAPSFGANTPIAVNGGTLRFALTSGSPTVAIGVTVTVNNPATLELAGSVSALSSGDSRASMVNNSTAGGILVSGTNQVLGPIDGSGTTIVNSGSNLTANHIVQGALIIGGASGSPAVVTIAASDSLGNSLAAPAGGASLNQSMELASMGSSLDNLAAGATQIPVEVGSLSTGGAAAQPVPPSLGGNRAAVPEPATFVLIILGGGALLAAFCRRSDC